KTAVATCGNDGWLAGQGTIPDLLESESFRVDRRQKCAQVFPWSGAYSDHSDLGAGDWVAVAIKDSAFHRHIVDELNRQLFGGTTNPRPATTVSRCNSHYLSNDALNATLRQISSVH